MVRPVIFSVTAAGIHLQMWVSFRRIER